MLHSKLNITIVKNESNVIGYLRYGGTNIWANCGDYDDVFTEIKKKHLYFLSKYKFYGKI
jgi:hypothetical protein